jgi:predicted dienelactone hydrolase
MHGRLILFVALLVACIAVPGGVLAQNATPVATTIALPTPTGPYSVGRTSFDWVDTARDEPFSEDTADQRQLVVWVWYPTEPLPNAPHAAYLPGVWGDLVGEALRIDLSGVEIHAVEGVPLALVHQRYPVVILSPGSGFVPAFYTALSEELASHGYIVVGVNHTYNAGGNGLR